MNPEFDPKKTQPLGGSGSDFQRTQIMGPGAAPGGTPPAGDLKKTQVVGGGAAGQIDWKKTQVYQGAGVSPQRQAPQNRKLVGWLVSFTIHPNGVDFRLYEGKNIIGSEPNCDIVLQDPGVSSRHLTILYRAGKFRFKDEMSTNGTFINGEMVEEGELQDGDIIRLGETELKFRAV